MFVLNFTQFVILDNLSIVDCRVLSEVNVVHDYCLEPSTSRSLSFFSFVFFLVFFFILLLLQSRCPAPDGFIDDREKITWSPVRNDDVNWNFEKVLIDHHGQPKARYTAPCEPEDLKEDILDLINRCEEEKNKGFAFQP